MTLISIMGNCRFLNPFNSSGEREHLHQAKGRKQVHDLGLELGQGHLLLISQPFLLNIFIFIFLKSSGIREVIVDVIVPSVVNHLIAFIILYEEQECSHLLCQQLGRLAVLFKNHLVGLSMILRSIACGPFSGFERLGVEHFDLGFEHLNDLVNQFCVLRPMSGKLMVVFRMLSELY